MNFFNIGTMELMVIVAIAILVVGPQRLVQVARTIGRLATRMRQISGEFTSIVRSELSELDEARQEVQAAVSEITGSGGEPRQGGAEVSDAVETTKKEADQSMQSLLDDGLGLSQIASELRATVSDARRFVEKAGEEEAAQAEASETEAAEAEAPEADAPDADALDAVAPDAETSEAEVSETEGREADASYADASETEGREADASYADASETVAAEAEAREAEVSETEGREADASDADASETVAAVAEAPEAEVSDTEGREADASNADASETVAAVAEAPHAEGGRADATHEGLVPPGSAPDEAPLTAQAAPAEKQAGRAETEMVMATEGTGVASPDEACGVGSTLEATEQGLPVEDVGPPATGAETRPAQEGLQETGAEEQSTGIGARSAEAVDTPAQVGWPTGEALAQPPEAEDSRSESLPSADTEPAPLMDAEETETASEREPEADTQEEAKVGSDELDG